MEKIIKLLPNYYRDSVALMQLSSKISKQPGITSASAQMATAANIELMVDAGLLDEALEPKPNDLLIVILGDSQKECEDAAEFAQTSLDEAQQSGDGNIKKEPSRSISMAIKENPEINLALISTPGEFAAAEALKALKQGLNVMMFSDNVPVEQEIMLKKYATENDLLVMGPDCGTAIIGGVPLAFANVVNRGPIGVIGASGTGVQQVTTLVDRLGSGISHAIGTGGHDLSEEVSGLTMLYAIDLLAKDAMTETIVLVSKPPAESVAKKIIEKAKTINKKVVVNFLGADLKGIDDNIHYVKTLEDAAFKAVELQTGKNSLDLEKRDLENQSKIDAIVNSLNKEQQYVRGIYTGGTFCYEAQLLLEPSLKECYSNTPTKNVNKLSDVWKSEKHTIVDLGDDDFTKGRPHPMIDPSLRNSRILQDVADPKTAIILFDLVLGYGAHLDPADELTFVIKKAKEIAKKDNREVAFIGFICGTDKDPQQNQEQPLLDAGVILATSNAHAVSIVEKIMAKQMIRGN